MGNLIKVAMIGAGRTGMPLIRELLKYRYIRLVGVADRKAAAAGLKLAARKGIFTTTDPMVLLQKRKNMDILIDVTDDAKLKKDIKSFLEKNRNSKTIIMHELIARLLISISNRKSSLTLGFHPKSVGVGK